MAFGPIKVKANFQNARENSRFLRTGLQTLGNFALGLAYRCRLGKSGGGFNQLHIGYRW
jgi:hypothetical protein